LAEYDRAHLGGCVSLFEGEGWRTYADDPERTASDLRRQGIARRLLREALQRDGGLRIDFISYAGHVSG